jgi:hypothetical protein
MVAATPMLPMRFSKTLWTPTDETDESPDAVSESAMPPTDETDETRVSSVLAVGPAPLRRNSALARPAQSITVHRHRSTG